MSREILLRYNKLVIALALSGAVNIIFMAIFGYWLLSDLLPPPLCALNSAERSQCGEAEPLNYTNGQIVRNFRSLSAGQLLEKFGNTQLIENGYSERDLALASLVAFHHFDLERALAEAPKPLLQMRSIFYGQNSKGVPLKITAFAGITEKQFNAIVHFAKTERFPYTPKGLYCMLRQQHPQCDESCIDAFAMTPEFAALERVFTRNAQTVDRKELIRLAVEGGWESLSTFAVRQNTSHDVSSLQRQSLLSSYIAKGSKTAAALMLKTDAQYALKKLDDSTLTALLGLLEGSPAAVKFALTLLLNPRSDAVWKSAVAALYSYAGEKCPERCSPQAALARFAPLAARRLQGPQPPEITTTTTIGMDSAAENEERGGAAEQPKLYLVQDGDNLWKISRRFKVNLNELKSHNHLISDLVHPGLALRIP